MGCLTSNKPFDLFGADPDHDPYPGIVNGIFTTAGIAAVVKVLLDQLPWWRFAVSECL